MLKKLRRIRASDLIEDNSRLHLENVIKLAKRDDGLAEYYIRVYLHYNNLAVIFDEDIDCSDPDLDTIKDFLANA